MWRISMEHFYNSGPQAQQRGFESTGPQEAEVLACERIEAAAPAALPAGAQDMRHSGQLTQEERRQRRERARDKATSRDRRTSSAPEGEVDIPEHPNRHYSTPPTRRQTTPTPAWAISLSTRAAASAWSFCQLARGGRGRMLHAAQLLREPTRARPFPHPSRQSFGIVARRQKSLCATRNRHRRPSPPLRLSLASISAAERAFQIDAPFTVSSFLQRMGRTGRRDLPPEMWLVMREEPSRAR